MSVIEQDRQKRKDAPLARGLLDYFPAAMMGVAECSRIANEQHNPGQEMHWARNKSNDHADCIMRHLIERDKVDEDGIPHVAKVAWRALALAQEYYEAQGYAPGLASRWDEGPSPRETFIEETTKTEAPNEELVEFKVQDRVMHRWQLRPDCGPLLGSVIGVSPGREFMVRWDDGNKLWYKLDTADKYLRLVKTEASNEEPQFKLHDRWYNDVFDCEGAVVEIREGEAYIQWEGGFQHKLPYRQCENRSFLTLVRRG